MSEKSVSNYIYISWCLFLVGLTTNPTSKDTHILIKFMKTYSWKMHTS
jgi:hypothetical protein